MGMFDGIKKSLQEYGETDVSKISFRRFDGFAGSIPQRFVDVSVPVCPMCKNNPHWMIHQSSKTVKMFPIAISDEYLFMKCEVCGMVMHTVFRKTGSSTFIPTNPSPRDNVTMMTFDVLGSQAQSFDLAGKQMSIWEINQMTEGKT